MSADGGRASTEYSTNQIPPLISGAWTTLAPRDAGGWGRGNGIPATVGAGEGVWAAANATGKATCIAMASTTIRPAMVMARRADGITWIRAVGEPSNGRRQW